MAIVLPLYLVVIQDKDIEFTILNNDRTAKDITGATIYSKCTSSLAVGGGVLWDKTSAVAADAEITDAAGGVFVIHINKADIEDATLYSVWYWDVWYVDSAGRRHPVVLTEDSESQQKSFVQILPTQSAV